MRACSVLFLLISLSSRAAIEDNSFLLEEAFNQKKGEYQFIHNYQSSTDGGQEYFFQVEAPLTHETHQLSFDFSYLEKSISDTRLNYRFQSYKKKGKMHTERVSIVSPTGSVKRGSGRGVYGLELLQSATFPLSGPLVNHWNLGMTFFEQRSHTDFTLGTSLVYLHRDDLNFLLETFYESEEEASLILNPGLRTAMDGEKSQIVTGLAFPLRYTEDKVYPGVFLYLSVEATLD